jgi:hypothetical protein
MTSAGSSPLSPGKQFQPASHGEHHAERELVRRRHEDSAGLGRRSRPDTDVDALRIHRNVMEFHVGGCERAVRIG